MTYVYAFRGQGETCLIFSKQICLSLRPAAVFVESKTARLQLPRTMGQGRLANSGVMVKPQTGHRIASCSLYWQPFSCCFSPHAKPCSFPLPALIDHPSCYTCISYHASVALQDNMLGFEWQTRTAVLVSLLDGPCF